MCRCAGLILTGAVCSAALAGSATAQTLGADSLQQALDAASEHPGIDAVVFGANHYDVGPGLVYSDRGQADNEVYIQYSCRGISKYESICTRLLGGAPGTPMLSFTGGGGAKVTVQGIDFRPVSGGIGLALPPGGTAERVYAFGAPDSVGFRLDGTQSRPARVTGGGAAGAPAVDAPGWSLLENTSLQGALGARARGNGNIDIRGGVIQAFTGVTGPSVQVTGTTINFANPADGDGPVPVGVEAICGEPDSADAEARVTNVTLVGHGPGAIGARAVGRGGDGASCDAMVRLSSSIVHDVGVSLDASGGAGSGSDPRDGVARIQAAYSNFRFGAVRQDGPAQLDLSSPGHNLDTDPIFAPPAGPISYHLLWRSPLIDAGDPASPEPWQEPWIAVVHGRRDIGSQEYGFEPPWVHFGISDVVEPGTVVQFRPSIGDDPGDQLGSEIRWTFGDGTGSSARDVNHRFRIAGDFSVRLRVTDPTGLTADMAQRIQVVGQRLSDFRLRQGRFRIHAAAADRVVVRFERRRRRVGDQQLRWVPLRGSLRFTVKPRYNTRAFNGRLRGRPLRPGRYRATATARSGGRSIRTRFRIAGLRGRRSVAGSAK